MKTFKLGLAVGFSQFCRGQLKDCFYMDGASAPMDFPCDPDAEVSACCGPGWRCASSLYCLSSDEAKIIGSCTDRSFKDNACPFPLIGGLLANGDRFSYTNNATICQDGTVCPNPTNMTCCNSGAGKKEKIFHYMSPVPNEVKDLSSFYALAGYRIPSSTTSSSSATVSMSSTSNESLVNGVLAPTPSISSSRATVSISLTSNESSVDGALTPIASASSSSATFSISPTSTESSVDGALAPIASASSSSATVSMSPNSTNSPINGVLAPTASTSSENLSSSAKVGIGVGIGLGIPLLLGLAIIFLRRHRKRKVPVDPLDLSHRAIHWPVTAEEIHVISVPAEMSGSGRRPYEMNGEPAPAELGRNNGEPYEI